LLNFPKDIFPKNRKEQKHRDEIELQKRDKFQETILKNSKNNYEIPNIQKLSLDVFPISQKFSCYSSMPYGIFSTIGESGCGPLTVEYALRLLGFSISLEEIVAECLEKSYRGYLYNEKDEIIDGSGTNYTLFSNVATELTNLDEILTFLEKGCPITILIQNSVYHNDEKRKGNHFITLIGIDADKNAILMDGNKITDINDPSTALVRMHFNQMIVGLRGAWAWEKEKIKNFIV